MEHRYIYLSLGLISALWLGWLIATFSSLPDVIPVHFNAAGEVDGWGSRNTIWITPLIGIPLSFLMILLPNVAPGMINYSVKITEENKQRQLDLVKRFMTIMAYLILFLFIYISWTMVSLSNEEIRDQNLGYIHWLFMGTIFALLGWHLWKAYKMR